MTVLFFAKTDGVKHQQNIKRISNILKSNKLKVRQNLETVNPAAIPQADLIIAEISIPSTDAGYLISESLKRQKKVLALYHGRLKTFFPDNIYQNLVCKKYTRQTLPSIIGNFLKTSVSRKANRFNFNISSTMADFLEKRSREGNLSKSVYLRQLIEKEMK